MRDARWRCWRSCWRCSLLVNTINKYACTRDDREWFSTFPLPPIPVQSIPIPSHSHSQFCHQFPFLIPIPIGNHIPMVISSLHVSLSKWTVVVVLLQIFISPKVAAKRQTNRKSTKTQDKQDKTNKCYTIALYTETKQTEKIQLVTMCVFDKNSKLLHSFNRTEFVHTSLVCSTTKTLLHWCLHESRVSLDQHWLTIIRLQSVRRGGSHPSALCNSLLLYWRWGHALKLADISAFFSLGFLCGHSNRAHYGYCPSVRLSRTGSEIRKEKNA